MYENDDRLVDVCAEKGLCLVNTFSYISTHSRGVMGNVQKGLIIEIYCT